MEGSEKATTSSPVKVPDVAVDGWVFRDDTLAERVALVTGASRGIGRACALAFARAGADVALFARSRESLLAVAREIEGMGRRALVCGGDVASLDDVSEALERTEAELGPLDVLLNNAGIHVETPFLDMNDEEMLSVVTVNLVGAMRWSRLAGQRMAGRGRGVILNMSSFFAERPAGTATAYAATKSGLNGFTRGLALELGRYGVRVVALQPGYIATVINAWLRDDPDRYRRLMRRVPLGRMGEPEEVGKLAVFLASDAAAYFTGGGVLMDGGASNVLA